MLQISALGYLPANAGSKAAGTGFRISFAILTNRKNKDGEEITTRIDCRLWCNEERAVKLLSFLKTGAMVYVSGEGFSNPNVGDNGQAYANLSCNVQQFKIAKFVGGENDG